MVQYCRNLQTSLKDQYHVGTIVQVHCGIWHDLPQMTINKFNKRLINALVSAGGELFEQWYELYPEAFLSDVLETLGLQTETVENCVFLLVVYSET